MLRLLLILSPLVFVPMLLPAVPAAPVPREANKPVYYFPTEVGAKWVYQSSTTEGLTTDVVTESEEKDGRFLVTVKMTSENFAGFSLNQYAVSKEGVFFVSHRLNPDDPPETSDPPHCHLKLPHKDGNTWENEGDFWRYKSVAKKVETVKVPAGTFQAIRVEFASSDWPGRGGVTWYAPGVGVVKHESWGALTELKSFELPKK